VISITRRAVALLWPHRRQLLFAVLQVFLITGLELLKPWPLKIAVDNVLGGQAVPWEFAASWSAERLLLAACVALVAIYLVLAAANLLHHYTTVRIGHELVNGFRAALYHHLQRLSLSFHRRRKVGDLLYRLTSDTYEIQTLTMNGVFPVLCSLILVVGMFIIMIRLDAFLTFVALFVSPVLLVLVMVSPLRRWLIGAATDMREQRSGVFSVLQWAIPGVRVIQAFTREDDEHRRFMTVSRQSLGSDLRYYLLQNLYSGTAGLVIAAGTAVVIWVGARHALAGALTIGELLVFVSYLTSLYGTIDSISQRYGMIEGARVGVQRVFEILDVEKDLPEGARSLPDGRVRGRVAWEGVSFHYVPGQPVLQRVDLHVDAGQTVAIVGHTGAGKSTLLSLLPRFYDPQQGQVSLDGIDVRELRLRDLRRQITMVLQPPILFPLTIHENIAYGRPESTREDVVRAAQAARIHDFIASLPHGYDTVLDELGATVSEGEKQRLTIARALLRDAPVLILDEPTSSVDSQTETSIMEGLRLLAAGRTTFIIAHRLSTVRQADRIVVLRSGRIVEQGGFDELLRADGEFALLCRLQFGGSESRRPALI